MGNQILISIGVLSSQKNNTVYHIIKKIFIKINYELIFDSNTMTILASKDKLVLIMELTSKTIENALNLELYFDILIQTSLIQEDYNSPFIKKMVNKAKYIIMNIDDESSRNILDKNVEGIIITYGINKKATITASSFSLFNNIEFNLCLQREYETIDKKKIEPMEIPIILNLIGRTNIYHGLGAIACGLVCGIDIEQIKDTLLNIEGVYRRLEKIYEKDYMIIDNYCNRPLDYNLVLEEVQNIKYKNIYIINSVEIAQGIDTIKKNLEVILSWVPILDIRKISLYTDKKEELIIHNINLLLTKEKVRCDIFFQLTKCIYNGILPLGQGDLLLLLGGESLKGSRDIINQLI